jgi:hypothetical protein
VYEVDDTSLASPASLDEKYFVYHLLGFLLLGLVPLSFLYRFSLVVNKKNDKGTSGSKGSRRQLVSSIRTITMYPPVSPFYHLGSNKGITRKDYNSIDVSLISFLIVFDVYNIVIVLLFSYQIHQPYTIPTL